MARSKQFVLKIRMSNAQMQTADEVAAALRDAADNVERWGALVHGDASTIRDVNGNKVGAWRVGTTENKGALL